MCAEEHQRYLLFSSLLRHTGTGLAVAQQQALVDLAAVEGRALEGGLASPALVLAVKVRLTSASVTLQAEACLLFSRSVAVDLAVMPAVKVNTAQSARQSTGEA